MSRVPILMTSPMFPLVSERLDAEFALHRLWDQPDPDAFVAEIGPEIRGVAASSLYGRVDARLFDRLPALEIVASFGVGYDHVDAELAAARGVIVTNTPGVLDEEVADLAVGLLLATLRRIPQADRFVREGRWETGTFPLSPTLRGRRIGILGLGAIGKAVARRLEGFGVEIGYHGRSRQADVPHAYHPTPQALAEASDVLIVVVPGGAATRHLVDAEILAALGPHGVLINVARGSVVDETALIAALSGHTILAAGLDVFAHEPHVPATLVAMPNVVLLPHVGSGTEHTRRAMAQLVIDNLTGWFSGRRVLTPVAECVGLIR